MRAEPLAKIANLILRVGRKANEREASVSKDGPRVEVNGRWYKFLALRSIDESSCGCGWNAN